MSCPDCFRGFLHDGTPRGALVKVGDLDAYYTGPVEGRSAKRPILFYIPDVFGMSFKNSQLLADSYAEKGGFHVYVEDIFNSDPLPPETLEFMEYEGWVSSLLFPFRLLWQLPTLIRWMGRHGDEVARPLVYAGATALRQAADALGVPLFAAGFCYGGRYSCVLAGEHGGVAPLVDACVSAHPSRLSAEEAAAVTKPTLYCLVPSDMFTPKHAADAISKQKTPTPAVVEVYPGQSHGFAVRGGPRSFEARHKCIEDVVAFFKGVQAKM
jgi:dienelactone hydrolase